MAIAEGVALMIVWGILITIMVSLVIFGAVLGVLAWIGQLVTEETED